MITALALPSSAGALEFNRHIDFCLGAEVTAKQVRPFAAKAWRLGAWERGKPPQRVREAHWQHVRCAAGPGHRKAIRRSWHRYMQRFQVHRKRKVAERRAARERARYDAAITPPGRAVLEQIASCESGGNPGAISPSGAYRGKYQFDYGTWASVGGSGDPAAAPEREQDERAAALYRLRGSQPWPVCGV